MISKDFQRRFNELENTYNELPIKNSTKMYGNYIPSGAWKQWATSVQNLVIAVFTKNSPHYSNFTSSLDECRGFIDEVDELHGIFLSAKDDFEGGYVFNIELRISGEIFGDFITLAKSSLSEGNKDVAAVLACSALEDCLKRLAIVNGFETTGKNMREVINQLKSSGLVKGAQKTILESMPKIRNAAMHADWEKISEPEVSSVIGFVEQFLLINFAH